ncbi:fungal-specific transcription factor domain-containing protein [Phialemonium atrogriseum]|uniref:Fungal-specific transcription factor domain-containing protein n=1 Tax=Phialemonium atrogriseum TaxID=1093897 RepID=A0AAJ0BVZ6_9PEZI|nr:fungal-specific transcription factor domain-containing protein [Phialemonium atrogriseum]KAK1765002.1 fungal-specific transcription factor domain-containing protein [Phialemonium atrogriseum]
MEKRTSPNRASAGVSAPRRNPNPNPNHAVPQLNCELCRDRKVRCDKLDPCTNCVSAGAVCVPVHRLRLRRGRHAHRSSAPVDDDLKRRIRRLEALISDAGPVGAGSGRVGLSGADSDPRRIASVLPGVTYSDPEASNWPEKRALLVQRPDHFWADLAEEIHGLRDVIESAPNEAEDDSAQTPEPAQLGSVHRGISILGLSGSSNPDFIPRNFDYAHPAVSHNRAIASQLCQVYLQQVDPIIKILHRPSLKKLMLQGGGYLGYPDGHASVEALSSAVMYSAASSMTDNQCQATFRTDKSSLMANCRRACEAAIERSGLLTTRDITVLQAFVLYLLARRSEERSRAVWTLLAVAVRIAKALSLYLDPEQVGRHETFFAQQMRKRLWLTICLMDVQASFGLASQPLIALKEAMTSSEPPSHINDSDFDLTTTHPIPDREGLTDTTFAIITYKLQLLGRLTNFGADEEKSCCCSGDGAESDMAARQQHVQRFEQQVLQLLHLCDPESSPYAWFTLHSAQCFAAGARACVLRPLQRLREGARPPPARVGGDTELLQLGARVLEKAMLVHTDPRGEGFRWYVTIPWHALAITVAECYICADAELVRRVWPTVETSYRLHEGVIARLRGGRLRGPLGKLMDRTREKLGPILHDSDDARGNPSFGIADSSAEISVTPVSGSGTGLGEGLADTLRETSISPASPDPALGAAYMPSTPLLPQPSLASTSSPSFGDQPLLAASLSPGGPASANDELDQSWGLWEEFVSDISFDDFTSPDMFFGENNMNGS